MGNLRQAAFRWTRAGVGLRRALYSSSGDLKQLFVGHLEGQGHIPLQRIIVIAPGKNDDTASGRVYPTLCNTAAVLLIRTGAVPAGLSLETDEANRSKIYNYRKTRNYVQRERAYKAECATG
jgi:hypothetical protein